jgi:hypothetical protein
MPAMRVREALFLGGLLAFQVSCGGDDSDSEGAITKGEYCESTGTAYCGRAHECQFASFDFCFQQFKSGCCGDDGSCSQRAINDSQLRALEQRCVDALSSDECSDVVAGVVPAACLMTP